MKLLGHIFQLHRPDFLKSDKHPVLKELFHRTKDEAVDASDPNVAHAQLLKQRDRAGRSRLLGGLVTVSQRKGEPRWEINKWGKGELSDEVLVKAFKGMAADLSKSWKNGDPMQEGSDFLAQAKQMQVEKQAVFAAAQGSPEKLQVALRCANLLHGKQSHNQNVASMADAFLKSSEIQAICEQHSPGSTSDPQFHGDVLSAANWHGLSDRDIPVHVLAQQRKMSDDDRRDYINPRSQNSGIIYKQQKLPEGQTETFIRQVRVFGDASRQRGLGPQILDLADRLGGMITKPSFYTDGVLQTDKVFRFIAQDLERDDVHIEPDLFEAIKQQVKKGTAEKALLEVRDADMYLLEDAAAHA